MFLLPNHPCKFRARGKIGGFILRMTPELYVFVNFSDDFTEMIVEKMKDNPQVVKLGSIITSILVLLGILIKFSRRSAERIDKKRT